MWKTKKNRPKVKNLKLGSRARSQYPEWYHGTCWYAFLIVLDVLQVHYYSLRRMREYGMDGGFVRWGEEANEAEEPGVAGGKRQLQVSSSQVYRAERTDRWPRLSGGGWESWPSCKPILSLRHTKMPLVVAFRWCQEQFRDLRHRFHYVASP